jgi:rhodanese-related sulfurtransferase
MNNISVSALKERLLNAETMNLLDVREPDERAEFNIGGNFIPLGQVMAMQVDELEDLKSEEIICYCRSGKRSMQAAMMLETMGFTNVVNLDGGMMAWQMSL